MISYLIAIVTLLTGFHIFTRYSKKGKTLDKIPGGFAYPIVGNLPQFYTNSLQQLFETGRKVVNEYYPITRLWFLNIPIVIIRHPDDVEILLSSRIAIDKGCVYDFFHPWLKTGLLTSTGDKWRQRRKVLTSAFHPRVLRKYLDIMNEEGKKCVTNLKSNKIEAVDDLVPFCTRMTLTVITEAAMGVKLAKMDTTQIKKYEKAIDDFGKIFIYRLLRPYLYDWMFKLPWKMGYWQTDTLNTLHSFSGKVVKERREYHKSTQNKYLQTSDDSNETSGGSAATMKKLALLDLLLAAEQSGSINAEGVKEEVDTFTLEGTDTTTLALSYSLILLAENKEAQDKARSEATELLNRTEGQIEIEDFNSLEYIERCIKESLRLFPPVPLVMRSLNEDLQLKNGLAPAGTQMVCYIYHLHHDPKVWSDPEKFDPDRFLPENFESMHPFAYVPFSAGPRNCIGYKFALMELKVMLARILYDYKLESITRSADIKLNADIVLRPAHPISVKFVKLQK